MQRVTVTLDDDLMAELDRVMASAATRTAPKRSAISPARGSSRRGWRRAT